MKPSLRSVDRFMKKSRRSLNIGLTEIYGNSKNKFFFNWFLLIVITWIKELRTSCLWSRDSKCLKNLEQICVEHVRWPKTNRFWNPKKISRDFCKHLIAVKGKKILQSMVGNSCFLAGKRVAKLIKWKEERNIKNIIKQLFSINKIKCVDLINARTPCWVSFHCSGKVCVWKSSLFDHYCVVSSGCLRWQISLTSLCLWKKRAVQLIDFR